MTLAIVLLSGILSTMDPVPSTKNMPVPVRDPSAALRIPAYRLFAVSQLCVVISAQIQSLALGWELYKRTNSLMSLAWIGLVQFLPGVPVMLWAGHAADRFDRRLIVIISLVVSLFCGLSLAALSYTQYSIPLMYLCVMVRSMGSAFGRPARQALLPQLVPADLFTNAVTWNSTNFQLGLVAGPALGGLIVKTSIPLAYLADSACVALSVILMLMLKCGPVTRTPSRVSLDSLGAGIAFVWRTKVILAALTLDLFAVLLGGATALFPVFAKDILHVEAQGLGWLGAAPAFGSVAMAMLLTHLPLKNAGRTLLWMVAGFGAATIMFGLSTSFPLSLFFIFLTGACDNISVVVRGTLVQLMAPDAMRGRVSAVNGLFIGASNQLGAFESGAVAYLFSDYLGYGHVAGARISVVSGGIGTLLVVAAVALLWPQLARVGALHEVKPEVV